MKSHNTRNSQSFRKTTLAALIASVFSGQAHSTNNEISPNTIEGVIITSNNDGSANGEGIFMYDNNVLVFSADQSQGFANHAGPIG